jgi:N-glycosylase/DNA lyase
MIQFLPGTQLDLADSLLCGQAFRWKRLNDRFIGVVDTSVVEVSKEEGSGEILVESSNAFDPIRYFRMEDDLPDIQGMLSTDPVLTPIIARFPGLRLLRQDPFETLISFILSQASGIQRISRTVRELAERFGEPIIFRGETFNAFPTPDRLSQVSESTFRGMGTGYRAPYLRAAARAVASGELDLDSLIGGGTKSGVSVEEARAVLMSLPGVGRKVADCVLLFSLDRLGVFPVDRWIARVVSHQYFEGRPVRTGEILDWAAKRFGEYSGYAQQYLFHHGRTEGRERFMCGTA